MPYILAPITGVDLYATLDEARDQAMAWTRKHGAELGGFIVFEVKEVGRYEHVSPIWLGAEDEHRYIAPRPTTKDFSPEVTIDPVRAPPQFTPDLDDEIPF